MQYTQKNFWETRRCICIQCQNFISIEFVIQELGGSSLNPAWVKVLVKNTLSERGISNIITWSITDIESFMYLKKLLIWEDGGGVYKTYNDYQTSNTSYSHFSQMYDTVALQ